MAGLGDFHSRDTDLFICLRPGDESTHDSRTESVEDRAGHGDGRFAGPDHRHLMKATQVVGAVTRPEDVAAKGKRPAHRGAWIGRVQRGLEDPSKAPGEA